MKTPTPMERFRALVDADHKRYIEYEDTNNATLAAEADFRKLAKELATELEQAQHSLAEMTALKEIHHSNTVHFARELEQAQGEIERLKEVVRELHAKGVLADRYSDMLEHVRNLERELNDWKDAADNASGCDTPEGLRGFIFSVG
jgi:chromosome segregation ATPase